MLSYDSINTEMLASKGYCGSERHQPASVPALSHLQTIVQQCDSANAHKEAV
jgi:hypothetical protein